jgi:sugar phosphate isomerase/epimerase
MKIGLFTVALFGMSLEAAMRFLKSNGVDALELPVRGGAANPHINIDELLGSAEMAREFKLTVEGSGMEMSALACHGNPVHPQSEAADADRRDFERAVLLAERLGVKKVITFSGCPGDFPGAKYPNWVTCPWPEDFLKILDYQWNDVLLPYWRDAALFARIHGVKVCLEMHPGFCVYNPETLLKLRDQTGDTIGANFDPSHLFWQGIDPVAAIRNLGKAVYHFHAKDVRIDNENSSVNGVLDTKHYGDEIHRSWLFRTVGYGHSEQMWKDMLGALVAVGYNDVLSIEHEDSLISGMEGLRKAIEFLKKVI